MSIESKLSQSPLFNKLTSEEIVTILSQVNYKIKKYKRGEIIAFRGEPCNRLIILTEGSITGEMQDFNGRVIKIDEVIAVAPLAPAFLFGKNSNFPIDVVPNEEVEAVEIPKSEVVKLFQINSVFLENYLNSVCNKTHFLTQKVWFNFSNKTIKQKVASYILGLEKNGNSEIILDRSLQELSEFFGIERPSLSRVFSEFAKDALIKKIDNKKYKILNRNSIVSILE
jgi:CRP/FNR family transcriptional regulator, dissimilatory nitrate respiration regulator